MFLLFVSLCTQWSRQVTLLHSQSWAKPSSRHILHLACTCFEYAIYLWETNDALQCWHLQCLSLVVLLLQRMAVVMCGSDACQCVVCATPRLNLTSSVRLSFWLCILLVASSVSHQPVARSSISLQTECSRVSIILHCFANAVTTLLLTVLICVHEL